VSEWRYQSGFGNYFESEAESGTLPVGRNSPQRAARGLYAEQINGSAFTAPNAENLRTWMYRVLPSVRHSSFMPLTHATFRSGPFTEVPPPPDQLRWDPLPLPSVPTDFVDGIVTVCGNGDAAARSGSAVHLFVANKSMTDRVFYNADGELLIVPQLGALLLVTELGCLSVEPQEIAVIPRGIKFQVRLAGPTARGYICENYGDHFQLPHRGPIGANGLASSRDFLTPVAWYARGDEAKQPVELVCKFTGNLWRTTLPQSPFDVVAWHGNYAPYKYDLRRFNTINTVSFDHPDPSIFTVLTAPSGKPGTANVDFVIFPPRWIVAEDTFRPPYFHRNIMSEYMGLVHGVYDAKPAGGFTPGGGSLHNCMSAHGPEAAAFASASEAQLKPVYQGDTLAFMFETAYVYRPTAWALNTPVLQRDYLDCWQGLQPQFK